MGKVLSNLEFLIILYSVYCAMVSSLLLPSMVFVCGRLLLYSWNIFVRMIYQWKMVYWPDLHSPCTLWPTNPPERGRIDTQLHLHDYVGLIEKDLEPHSVVCGVLSGEKMLSPRRME